MRNINPHLTSDSPFGQCYAYWRRTQSLDVIAFDDLDEYRSCGSSILSCPAWSADSDVIAFTAALDLEIHNRLHAS